MEYLTVPEYAELRGCSRQNVLTLIKNGKLVAEKTEGALGGGTGGISYRIPLAACEPKVQKKYINRQKKLNPPPPEPKPKLQAVTLEEMSREERQEVAKWKNILDEWKEYREMGGPKKERDEEFVDYISKKYPEFHFSVRILQRQAQALREQGEAALIDRRGKHKNHHRAIPPDEDAAHYEALAASILEDIREEFYSPNGRSCVNTQTGALLTLSEKLADPGRALEQLLHLLEVNEDKLKTGFVGTPLLCEQLAAHGQEKLADKILLNEEYPGWLYAVNLGATTIWERWNSLDETGHVSSTGMNSLNHYSYGAIASYIWKSLAGLQLLPEAPGGRRVKIAPHVNWKLRHLNAEYPSAVGTYFIFWELPDTEHIHLTVTVPAGGEAEVVLPLDKENRIVTVSGDTLDITYSASRAFFVHRSIDDTLQTLMCNSECRKILKEEIPTLDVLLAFTRANPLRETMQNLRYEKAMIERVETRLSEVIE